MKKIVLMISMCLMAMVLASCNYYHEEEFTHGDFIYATDKDGFNSIISLTEEAKEKEVLVIPDYLDGKPVRIGATSVMGTLSGNIISENVKKIFVLMSEERNTVSLRIESIPNLEKVIQIGEHGFGVVGLTQNNTSYKGMFWAPLSTDINNRQHFYANVIYDYNYDIEQDYYWIDDYDDELISYTPEEPAREGYSFDGWYKEKDGINKWDFANDKVLPKIYDEDGTYHYQETRLYAKWILN